MALVSNVERLATYDGPGLRTVIYFQACPLKCTWCSNPETQAVHQQLMINHNSCLACQRCVKTCSKQALSLTNKLVVDQKLCDACGDCVGLCPTRSLKINGQEYSVEQLVELCLKDRVYYEKSGGGITVSGGEMLMHSQFVIDLFTSLRHHEINTAFETSAYGSTEDFIKILDLTDYPIIDYKLPSAIHQKYTGRNNDLIKTNIEVAVRRNPNLLIRIPIIPGINDDRQIVTEMAQQLVAIGVRKVELLKCHSLGTSKYEQLNLAYAISGEIHLSQIQEYKAILKQYNIETI